MKKLNFNKIDFNHSLQKDKIIHVNFLLMVKITIIIYVINLKWQKIKYTNLKFNKLDFNY